NKNIDNAQEAHKGEETGQENSIQENGCQEEACCEEENCEEKGSQEDCEKSCGSQEDCREKINCKKGNGEENTIPQEVCQPALACQRHEWPRYRQHVQVRPW
ncbi:MAG: hypothetical protein OES99_06635, partial [Gammaproteobacteria bacterium]|nr:hypothetical protein [Gammaproteobacteria bacterium]